MFALNFAACYNFNSSRIMAGSHIRPTRYTCLHYKATSWFTREPRVAVRDRRLWLCGLMPELSYMLPDPKPYRLEISELLSRRELSASGGVGMPPTLSASTRAVSASCSRRISSARGVILCSRMGAPASCRVDTTRRHSPGPRQTARHAHSQTGGCRSR